jgi:hypothetical protein
MYTSNKEPMVLTRGIILALMVSSCAMGVAQTSKFVKPKLTLENAQQVALAKEPGKVRSAELEAEGEKLVYSFDIERNKVFHKVHVDANDGTIISDNIQTAAEEAKEREAENNQKQRKK